MVAKQLQAIRNLIVDLQAHRDAAIAETKKELATEAWYQEYDAWFKAFNATAPAVPSMPVRLFPDAR